MRISEAQLQKLIALLRHKIMLTKLFINKGEQNEKSYNEKSQQENC